MSYRAIALISGGLDSILAAKVIKIQGVDVLGLCVKTVFNNPNIEGLDERLGIPIEKIDISQEFLTLIKNPRFGFGKNLNPCIDCHILMSKKAREFLVKHNAHFVVSGEVVGQRPMSQYKAALRRVEEESKLTGLLLRPLSAKLLPLTIPEQKEWVDRERLFDFQGRSRKPQLALAAELGIKYFNQPAGGCLLTDFEFSQRLRDLLNYNQDFNVTDITLLKLGRHFRLSDEVKFIVGRNEEENGRLTSHHQANTFLLTPVEIPGPTGLLIAGSISPDLVALSASILARYCDSNKEVEVSVINGKDSSSILCSTITEKKLEELRI